MAIDEKLKRQITEVKYLNVENVERYRPIMRYFFKQYEKLEYWLYKEDVFNALKDDISDYSIELCDQDLLKLTEWGNLTNVQDTSNVQTIEEFKNRKYRYQLTEYSIEIERMVKRLETLNIETASLEPRLFEKLRLLLEKIIDINDLSEINSCFEELNETFTKLNNNYKDFLKMFNESKSEELMKSEQFLIYKDRVIEYLNNFMAGFQINEIKIKKILSTYPIDFEDKLIERLILYKKMQPIIEPNFDYEYLEEVMRGKWESIIRWFSDSKYEESESERLRRAINNTINKITKFVVSIIENTGINRIEEYRHILKLFLNSNDNELEEFIPVIFGIQKIKHFTDINLENDLLSTSPKDVTPSFIELKSHSRMVSNKLNRTIVEDKFYEKEAQLEVILKKKEKEEKLLRKYIEKGEISIKDLNNIETFERRFILSLITKSNYLDDELIKNAEYGVFYKINKINDEEVKLSSIDGILTMPNIKIIFLGDKNGI